MSVAARLRQLLQQGTLNGCALITVSWPEALAAAADAVDTATTTRRRPPRVRSTACRALRSPPATGTGTQRSDCRGLSVGVWKTGER